MNQMPMRFTLHKQCQNMFETYRRDAGIGQSALESYQRAAQIQTALRESLRPSPTGTPVPSRNVVPLKRAACRKRTTASPQMITNALASVAFG